MVKVTNPAVPCRHAERMPRICPKHLLPFPKDQSRQTYDQPRNVGHICLHGPYGFGTLDQILELRFM